MPFATPIQKNIFKVWLIFPGRKISLSAQSVSGITLSRSIIEWREGFMLHGIFPGLGLQEPFTVQISRAKFENRNDIEKFLVLFQSLTEDIFFKTEIELFSKFNLLKGGEPYLKYLIFPCVLKSISPFDELSADGPDFVIEEIEIQATYIIPVKTQ